jgi:hypothetical protein
MNSVRNSNDHASYLAVGILTVLLAVGVALFLAARSATLPQGDPPGGFETPKAGLR